MQGKQTSTNRVLLLQYHENEHHRADLVPQSMWYLFGLVVHGCSRFDQHCDRANLALQCCQPERRQDAIIFILQMQSGKGQPLHRPSDNIVPVTTMNVSWLSNLSFTGCLTLTAFFSNSKSSAVAPWRHRCNNTSSPDWTAPHILSPLELCGNEH